VAIVGVKCQADECRVALFFFRCPHWQYLAFWLSDRAFRAIQATYAG
jgi:hypothetical protein